MAKSHNRYLKARLVPGGKETQQRAMSVTTRPLRLGFVINEDVTQEQILKLVEYNSMIWGGYFNLMIPTNGKEIRDDWFQSLINHNPDFIIVVGKVEEPLIERIFKCIQPYYMWQWSDDILSKHLNDEETIGSLSARHVLNHIYNSNRQISNSNIRIPQVVDKNPFYFHTIVQTGKVPQDYEEYCINQLKGQYIKFSDRRFQKYLSYIDEVRGKLTPIRITRLQLSTSNGFWGIGFTIVLSGSKPLHDLCLFWNLRAQPALRRENILFLPVSSLRGIRGITSLAEYCNTTVKGSNYIVLASASVSKGQLLRIRERIKPLLNTDNIEFVDTWFANFSTGGFYVRDQERREDVTVEDRFFRLKSVHPNIESVLGDSRWVVDVQIEAEGRQSLGFLPPTFPDLNQFLSNNPDAWIVKASSGYRVRFANGHISYRVDRRTEFIGSSIPSDQQVLQSLLDSYGYSSVLSDKCRYAQGMDRLMGGIEEVAILRNARLRELLHAMTTGTAYTPREMLSFLKPGSSQKEQEHASDLITDLAFKRIFLRGYNIHCPACDLTRWYPVDDIGETMQCAGCLTEVQPSIEAHFSYRLNELMARGEDQGCIPVLLTLLFLRRLSKESFMFVPGMIINKGSDTDIDIISSCDGDLVLVECKDLQYFKGNKFERDVYSQVLRTTEIAKDIGASIVFLSTMIKSVSEDLRKQIELLNKRIKGKTVVHLLTLPDLERGYKIKAHPSDSSREMEESLTDFLPRKLPKKSGWMKEPGSRRTSF